MKTILCLALLVLVSGCTPTTTAHVEYDHATNDISASVDFELKEVYVVQKDGSLKKVLIRVRKEPAIDRKAD